MKGDNCAYYRWQIEPWTSCLINNGTDNCGVGYRESYMYCEDENHRRVDDDHCIKVGR